MPFDRIPLYRHLKEVTVGSRFRRLRFIAAFVLYGLIVLFGLIPGVRAEIGQFASGLVLHSIAYSTIAFLLFSGLDGSRARNGLISLLNVAVMGAMDEFIQSFVPYRLGRIEDWIVDISAASLALLLLMRFYPGHAAPGASARDRIQQPSGWKEGS